MFELVLVCGRNESLDSTPTKDFWQINNLNKIIFILICRHVCHSYVRQKRQWQGNSQSQLTVKSIGFMPTGVQESLSAQNERIFWKWNIHIRQKNLSEEVLLADPKCKNCLC